LLFLKSRLIETTDFTDYTNSIFFLTTKNTKDTKLFYPVNLVILSKYSATRGTKFLFLADNFSFAIEIIHFSLPQKAQYFQRADKNR